MMKFTKKRMLYGCLFLFAVLLIILCFMHYKTTLENFEDFEETFGFIITRHVNSEDTNKLWTVFVSQIKKFYPTTKIVIIDNNSNRDFITDDDVDMKNCEILYSEYKNRGELLPYYYFDKYKWFDKAIFIHDSVLINNKINIDNVDDVKFLWHFNGGELENSELIENLLSKLNHGGKLIELGCWGVMSVIHNQFLTKIMDKYNMKVLLEHVTSKEHRMAMERIFGVICIYEKPKLMESPCIFGYYGDSKNNRNSDSYNFNEYMEDVNSGNMKSDINKLFFGR